MSSLNGLIVDDHPAIRTGILSALQGQIKFKSIREAGNINDAKQIFKMYRIDVMITDLSLNGEDGFILSEYVKKNYPLTRMICYTMHRDWSYLRKAFDIGVDAYILKDSEMNYLVAGLQSVIAGKKVFPVEMRTLLPEIPDETKKKMKKLSKRELEVLHFIGNGCMNREIAENLSLSVRTVESHRASIIQKLELGSSMELVQFAISILK
ncbi:MAG: response regulator transcription factor [Leptospira sp.]|nr:response regulator transcription factor [Leptospira sp.]